MEQDRFSANNRLYVLGIISLILALGLFFFSMYILPFLIWNLHYDVPEFLTHLITFIEKRYDYGEVASKTISWLVFFLPGLVAGYISYYISNHIDDQILGLAKQTETEEKPGATLDLQTDIKESLSLTAKIILWMILIVFVLLLLEVAIRTDP
ncbi:hypothetical protein [Legionella worsleiensis]|uniref:Transmembrane protein n=1 Tax=Legionella worsleiensis TaxID=45076 RepID=A0A0W1AJ21_9GAMM|nr:hypothetical protein [Legionella worsleiensis]KTD81375.1 transmembrane protein [Legionella worsleiensis]STY29995.1 transmembrane protein [Legionella worsleiensis]